MAKDLGGNTGCQAPVDVVLAGQLLQRVQRSTRSSDTHTCCCSPARRAQEARLVSGTLACAHAAAPQARLGQLGSRAAAEAQPHASHALPCPSWGCDCSATSSPACIRQASNADAHSQVTHSGQVAPIASIPARHQESVHPVILHNTQRQLLVATTPRSVPVASQSAADRRSSACCGAQPGTP